MFAEAGGKATTAMLEGEDQQLHNMVEAVCGDSDNDVILAFKITESQPGAFSHADSKPRVLAITSKRSGHGSCFFMNVFPQPAKLYKLKHLSKVEILPSDRTGCTLLLSFDSLEKQNLEPAQWTMRTLDDRNLLLTNIIRLSRENLDRVPTTIGMDMAELALWEQVQTDTHGNDHKLTVNKELMSKTEEDELEALLGMYVLDADELEQCLDEDLWALEDANVHAILQSAPLVEDVLKLLNNATEAVEDMEECLGVFNVKLRHMHKDIESIESRNNMLEVEEKNSVALIEELSKLQDRFRVPSQYATVLTTGALDESRLRQSVEACDWLAGALQGLEPPLLDPAYANMRAVKDKRLELEKLKSTYVCRATEYLRNYFSSVVEIIINDTTHFSQKGQLKNPDHADLRYKCRTYARLLQHLKSFDANSLVPLRKAYCQSLNLLLRREAREFANELRASTKVSKSSAAWMEGSSNGGAPEAATASGAYAKMLHAFIPFLVDESSFFASFMCYEVPKAQDEKDQCEEGNDEDDSKPSEQNAAEIEALNQALQELLDGVQDDFYAVLDWVYKTDPLQCITIQGVTQKYLSSHKADAATFVRRLLSDLQARINSNFNKLIDDICNQIGRHDSNIKQTGVLSFIPKFAALSNRMEKLVEGMSRDMVDLAYPKLVVTMFSVLERIAQVDPKYADVLLLENYAAFQNHMFEVAITVPTLKPFYQQASEAYEQACTRYVNSIINMQFEKLFQFAVKVENALYTVSPEEVPFQQGILKSDLRKVLKASLSGVERSIQVMYKRMQKNLTSNELMPNLWEKCENAFIDKYESLEALLQKCYPTEVLSPSCEEMKQLLQRA